MKDETPTELVAAVREIVRYAIMTLNALHDPDARYKGFARLPGHVVRDTQEAYGWTSAYVRSFQPSPRQIAQMELVLPWLSHLQQAEGRHAVQRIIAYALGVPLWRLGQREGCGEKTILNRINRSILLLIRKYVGVELPIEYGDEPYRGVSYAFIWEQGDPALVGGEIKLQRIYIGGRGLWQSGKGWLDKARRGYGAAKAERMAV